MSKTGPHSALLNVTKLYPISLNLTQTHTTAREGDTTIDLQD